MAAVIAVGLLPGAARAAQPECDEPTALCIDSVDSIGYGARRFSAADRPL